MITDLSDWTPRQTPTNAEIRGRHVTILPFDRATHEGPLWEAFGGTATNDLLYHFGWPRMQTAADLGAVIARFNDNGHLITCVFADPGTNKTMGMASYLRTDERNGVTEVGAVAHGAPMARSRASTEAHYLMARRVFDELGYRRYEWKLNNPNQASHRAARRFGFVFEGVFHQLEVKPYGNRDTAWYAMLDRDWPAAKQAFELWLDDENFDTNGGQRQTLQQIRVGIHAKQT